MVVDSKTRDVYRILIADPRSLAVAYMLPMDSINGILGLESRGDLDIDAHMPASTCMKLDLLMEVILQAILKAWVLYRLRNP